MEDLNNVCLIGRITRDLELKYIPNSNTAVTKFNLAVDKGLSKEKKQEMESKGQSTADFINITVWGKSAENCANFLSKGRLVGVQGRIQTGKYQDNDGKTIYTTEVVANNVEFLEFGDKKETNQGIDDNIPSGFQPTDNDDIPF